MITSTLMFQLVLAMSAQSAPDVRSDLPYDISAERCEVFEVEDKIKCTGRVRVVQGEAILTADEMTVFGATSAAGFERIEGEGDVRYAEGVNAVSGRSAVFDGVNSTITVIGDVVVIQGEQVMVGGRLVYNTETGAMVFEPGETGRVRGVFYTANANAEGPN